MDNRTITYTICLKTSDLGSNIMKHIKEQIKNTVVGHCDRDYGYIIEIGDEMEIIDNAISSSGIGVFFTVKFPVRCLKPKEGDVFEGEVIMVFDDGIIVEVEGLMKIFINQQKLTGFTYDKIGRRYVSHDGEINIGCRVKSIITAIEYERKNFNCIGSLKDYGKI